MTQLVFDEALSRRIESMYARRDFHRRRRLVQDAVGARPGEDILDVGCGPGFYVAELLDRVGPEGTVVGVDSSPQMLGLAAHRCEGHANVAFHEAPATSLPVDDAGFDAALSVQVLEYVGDVDTALAEMRRALRPGGRVVLWDIDWSTVTWHSSDAARMDRVLRAFEAHLTHPTLPRTLAARLRSLGFDGVTAEGHAFTATELDEEAYGPALLPMIRRFVAGVDGIDEAEARAWEAEQRELGERGEFFFSCVQFCFRGVR
ncbi:MAG TPA: methyltransferase domain-containing protein [Candidatus Dormibacteraeota bacterium]|nr:methyltransferase domain-containing protein [Candidatus Dormibacteraeota bacterium]